MALLGEDEASGKRQPFMAENRMYYLTSPADDPNRRPDDKLGLWHPYFHDTMTLWMGYVQTPEIENGDRPHCHFSWFAHIPSTGSW